MRHQPERSCIGCRAARPKRELVRVVHTPDDRFLLDATGKQPGRGAYLCPEAACLAAAVKRKSFDRAFRQAVPRESVAALEAALSEYLRAGPDAARVERRQGQGDAGVEPVSGGTAMEL